jgi:hypothetical protein
VLQIKFPRVPLGRSIEKWAPCWGWQTFTALLIVFSALSGQKQLAHAQESLLQGVFWGEPQSALLAHFGRRALVLQRPIDFGDTYTQIVLRDVELGGVPLIAFFQIDKVTGGLKRVQIERQRHGVNRPAFRGVVRALQGEYGAPDAACSIRPTPQNGYQGAAELDWSRGGNLIRAVFRDTTIEAVEGCFGDLSAGPCGLTGQLFVRISPRSADAPSCQPATH